MRLGLLIYGDLATLSGGYLYDRKLVEHLRRQNDEVEIISMPWRGYARHLGDNLSTGWLYFLKSLHIDILLQDELNHPSLFWLNRRLRQQGVSYPIVTIVHHLRSSEAHPAWHNQLYRWVERQYLQSVDGFIFNSQTTRKEVERLDGIQKTSVVAYPAGDRFAPEISKDEIIQRAHSQGPLRLVFAGNLIPRKGLHILLEALRNFNQPDWELTVAGSCEVDRAYVRIIRHKVKVLGFSERVRILGSVDDGQLAAALRKSHLLVVPSSYEGFGIVYLEGMGFGLPAVGTTAGGATEIITSGKNGFLIAPGDSTALAERLQMLSQNRELLAEMSISARRRFDEHPGWERSTKKMRHFLAGLIADKPADEQYTLL